jgi:hypothetical protein
VDFTDPAPGTDGLVAKLAEKADIVGELLIPPGPAEALVDALESAGVTVRRMKADEVIRAHMAHAKAVEDGEVAHLGQARLTRAWESAARRVLRDGAWRLSRSDSGGDISPATATACAWFAVREFQPAEPPPPKPGYVSLNDYLDEE